MPAGSSKLANWRLQTRPNSLEIGLYPLAI
jgi:hypothetical protein